MNNSEETLQNEPILAAIAELSKEIKGLNSRLDTLEKTVESRFDANDGQFEIIREGIVYNSARFDRMEAKIFDARSDISNFRADIKELTVQTRRQGKRINGGALILEK